MISPALQYMNKTVYSLNRNLTLFSMLNFNTESTLTTGRQFSVDIMLTKSRDFILIYINVESTLIVY